MRAVVLAKTRMGVNICVGALDLATRRAVRLVPRRDAKFHSWNRFEAAIGEVVSVAGAPAPKPTPPHVEDYLVDRCVPTGERVDDLPAFIRTHCHIWRGPPTAAFGGGLRASAAGSLYLPQHGAMPAASVGFWELDRALFLREREDLGRIKRSYICRGFRIAYVGMEPAVEALPRGTLVRVSLARWTSFSAEAGQECWLQLSGWYGL